MKNSITIISALLFLASCNKPVSYEPNPSDPQMIYTDLENKEIRFNESSSLDLNKDGLIDISFHTQFVGDPIAKQDKEKYLVSSKINCMLPVNSNENTPMLLKGDTVPLNNFSGYSWYGFAHIELAQKVTGIVGDPFWEGLWRLADHKYLPVQLIKNNRRFNGWVELSFDINKEKIILHKAAISKLPERDVIAGI